MLETGESDMSEAQSEAQVDRVRDKIMELQEALDAAVPGFPHILKDIHDTLRAAPEVVTILAEEEIAVIVKGLEKHAGIEVTPAKAKKAASAKSKVPISATDL